jgi:hypothetical protein
MFFTPSWGSVASIDQSITGIIPSVELSWRGTMVQNAIVKPLGTVLLRGGLVSPAQVEVALVDQRSHPHLRIGDVLELRGWIDRSTVDFFSERWPKLVSQGAQQPIGEYLLQAGLISQNQLNTLLQEQMQTGLRIGALAVLRGWLKQETLDLLLQGIAPEHKTDSAFKTMRQRIEEQRQALAEEQAKQAAKARSSTESSEEEIPWVD